MGVEGQASRGRSNAWSRSPGGLSEEYRAGTGAVPVLESEVCLEISNQVTAHTGGPWAVIWTKFPSTSIEGNPGSGQDHGLAAAVSALQTSMGEPLSLQASHSA
jgi:hypothetical protein